MDPMITRAKILLVDDRPENLLALEAILSSLDQELVRAHSGEEALRALLKDEFALILLDAQMPGMDGFETATRIKRRNRTKDVPIIFLTAVDKDQHYSYRGYAAGGADYISKPFDPWVLRAKVQVFVDLWATGRRLAAQAAFLREQVDEHPPDVLRSLERRLADVEEAVTQLSVDVKDVTDQSVTDAVARVGRRLGALREAFAAIEAPTEVSPEAPRGFG
jgi:CheY-like chemotaxis protein